MGHDEARPCKPNGRSSDRRRVTALQRQRRSATQLTFMVGSNHLTRRG